MATPDIVVVGSSNTDLIVKLDRIPRPGETMLGEDLVTAAGGKGANQAVSAARAGGRVALVACVGRDSFGEQALAGFERDSVDLRFIRREKKAPSGVALICVAKNGENSIAVASGANGKLSPADVRRARSVISRAKIVVAQLEIPIETVKAAARMATECGARFILNPAPARDLSDALLQRVSLLTPNETEAELLTGVKVDGEAAAAKACALLRRRGAGAVILTLGSRGAYVAEASGETMMRGFKVKAVDTTAAGDVFNGALAVALAEGQPLGAAARFANAAAALSVTRFGAQPSAPTRLEIERMLRR